MSRWRCPEELFVLIGVVVYLSLLFLVKHTWRRCRELGLATPANVSAWKLLGIAVIPFGLLAWLLRGRREGLFRGTVARSMIPVFAVAMIILAGGMTAPGTMPHRVRCDRWQMQNNNRLLSNMEGSWLSRHHKMETLAVFEQIEKENKP